MSDTYQAVYDAVRSRISNPGDAIERVAWQQFDISHIKALAQEAVGIITNAYDRPSAVYRPALTRDGNMFCALYGENLAEGCAGFGETADAAMWDFDKNWHQQKASSLAEKTNAGDPS